MLMKNLFYLITIHLIFILFTGNIYAQTENDTRLFNELIEQDQRGIDALVLYPENIREAILEASASPEVLVKLEDIQNRTRQEFIVLIEELPRDEQMEIYEISRYNGLLRQLTENRRQLNEEDLNNILNDYPEEIRETARKHQKNNFQLLNRINRLEKTSELAFEEIINKYPAKTQNAYRELIRLPEIMDIMSDNMRMTVFVGTTYENNPQWIKNKLDSLQLEASKRNAEELESWKNQLENNPEALAQLQETAENYAQEKGFSEEEYRSTPDQTQIIHYHHYYSYPFWFGYPWWYPYAYWYRYPWWYDWGFYYGPGNIIMLTGMPSFYFTYWYFHYPRHHYHYPHLSDAMANHYTQHARTSYSGLTAGVGTWVENNRDAIPKNLFDDDVARVQRFREYGQFEAEYNVRQQRTRREITRENYLEANKRNFPNLSPPDREAIDRRPSRGRPDIDRRPERTPQLEQPGRRRPPAQTTPPPQYERRPTPPPVDRTPPPRTRPSPAPERRPTPPPAQRTPPPSQRIPTSQNRYGKHIKIQKAENGLLMDNARIHHNIIWRKSTP
jgi:predicted transcriptional regulator